MKRVITMGATLVVLAVLGGCATGVQPDDPFAIKVNKLSHRINQLEQVVKNQNRVSLGQRLDRLAEQVRTLRGQVQELAHAVDESNTRQRHLYQDLDSRLRALETDGGSSSKSTSSPLASESGRTDYDHAFNLLQQGKYNQAEQAFSEFLGEHPDSELADNAQYWLGESHYVTREYKEAVAAFQAVIDGYPDSPKLPGALLKMGYSYAELSKWDDARQALNKVVENYSDSTEARLARDRLKKLKKEGH